MEISLIRTLAKSFCGLAEANTCTVISVRECAICLRAIREGKDVIIMFDDKD